MPSGKASSDRLKGHPERSSKGRGLRLWKTVHKREISASPADAVPRMESPPPTGTPVLRRTSISSVLCFCKLPTGAVLPMPASPRMTTASRFCLRERPQATM